MAIEAAANSASVNSGIYVKPAVLSGVIIYVLIAVAYVPALSLGITNKVG